MKDEWFELEHAGNDLQHRQSPVINPDYVRELEAGLRVLTRACILTVGLGDTKVFQIKDQIK